MYYKNIDSHQVVNHAQATRLQREPQKANHATGPVTGPPPKLLVNVTVCGLLLTANVNAQFPGLVSVMLVLPTGFWPAAVRNSMIAGSKLVVVATTVTVETPFWFLPVALTILIVSTGGGVTVPDAAGADEVDDGVTEEEGATGAQDVAAGAAAPGHGFSWPTMTGGAGGVNPNVPGT